MTQRQQPSSTSPSVESTPATSPQRRRQQQARRSRIAALPDRGAQDMIRFQIFNSTFGPNEGEEAERIVFYHPNTDSEELKCKSVGFAEASINFARAFFPEEERRAGSVRSCHTQRTRSVLREVEPDFWVELAVSVPFVKRKRSGSGRGYAVDYEPENVHDSVLDAMVQHAYEMFRFFMGPFAQLLEAEEGDVARFKIQVQSFFSKFVHTIRPAQAGIHDLFRAIQFLGLETTSFLNVQCLISRLEDEFPIIESAVFFHQGNVIWSELQQEDTRLLYYYLVESLLPSSEQTSTGAAGAGAGGARSPFGGHQGRFLTGGPQTQTISDLDFKIPTVFLEGGEREHHLIVYHALGSSVCIFIPVIREPTVDFFRQLDASLGPALTNMSADLMDVFGQDKKLSREQEQVQAALLSPSVMPGFQTAAELIANSVRFLYFNRSNLAMKSTLYMLPHEDVDDASGSGYPELSQNLLNAMLDLCENFTRYVPDDDEQQDGDSEAVVAASRDKECYLKLSNDQWVIGKSSDKRQIYVVICERYANLMDAADEMARLMKTEFKNICLNE